VQEQTADTQFLSSHKKEIEAAEQLSVLSSFYSLLPQHHLMPQHISLTLPHEIALGELSRESC